MRVIYIDMRFRSKIKWLDNLSKKKKKGKKKEFNYIHLYKV